MKEMVLFPSVLLLYCIIVIGVDLANGCCEDNAVGIIALTSVRQSCFVTLHL